ncbi:MAG TPA: hypothetical protein VJQ25_02910, partial [Nitrospira sp.]|nr:hypothetical protein [Nitrospira sp.]
MTRWLQRRKRYQQTRNAFLLLTISGAVRSADVEVPYCRERRVAMPSKPVPDTPGKAKPSIWSMDLRELVFRTAARQL